VLLFADNFHERGGSLSSLNGSGTDEKVGYTTTETNGIRYILPEKLNWPSARRSGLSWGDK
jgi:hypothetical protein